MKQLLNLRSFPFKSGLIIFIILLATSHKGNAQQMEIPRNEINYNLLNTIVFGSAEVGYEYFFDYDQSVGVKLLINDRRNFKSEHSGQKYNTNSVQVNYSYYFGQNNPGSGFYIQPFLKYRFGNFKEEIIMYGAAPRQVKTNMDAFMIGAGVGYVINFSNSFVLGPYFNFARNFSNDVKARFSAFDIYGGFNLGYRF